MMENSMRSGSIVDGPTDGKEPTARDAERTGKAGEAVEGRSFTIHPKAAVIEISGGRVVFKVGKAAESVDNT
jgi:hypothetical protein